MTQGLDLEDVKLKETETRSLHGSAGHQLTFYSIPPPISAGIYQLKVRFNKSEV